MCCADILGGKVVFALYFFAAMAAARLPIAILAGTHLPWFTGARNQWSRQLGSECWLPPIAAGCFVRMESVGANRNSAFGAWRDQVECVGLKYSVNIR